MIGYLYFFSIGFSAILAIVFRKSLAGRKLIILIPFLLLTFVQEIILESNKTYHFFTSTSIPYNIYRPITAIVFFIIYYNIPFLKSLRKLMTALFIFYMLLVLVTYFFITPITENNSYLPIARGLLVTFFAVLFLLRYFDIDPVGEGTYWRPMVWITAGIAIFYSVVTTSLSFQDYLSKQMVVGMTLYQLIPRIMSIFMYGCFSYAFYLCKKLK